MNTNGRPLKYYILYNWRTTKSLNGYKSMTTYVLYTLQFKNKEKFKWIKIRDNFSIIYFTI